MKKYTFAVLISALVMFLLAGLWNFLVVPNLGLEFPEGFVRQAPIFPLIIIGYLILGFAIVFLGSKSSFSSNKRLHWVIAGAFVMEVAFGVSSLVLQANYNFPLKAIPLDLIWYLVEGGAGGYVASFLVKKNA